MADPRSPTRADLAKFLPDQRTIRAFEKLFELVPDELGTIIEEALIQAGSADARSQQAIDYLARISNSLETLAKAPMGSENRTPSIDYVDFALSPNHSSKVGRMAWNDLFDTLDLHHSGGVTQSVGLETYIRFENTFGSTLANGTLVGLNYTGGPTTDVVPYIANGSIPALNILGVITEDVADGTFGRLTNFGVVRDIDTTGTPYSETWLEGDLLYASPTVSGGLTNVKPTAPNWSIPTALVTTVSSTVGTIFVRPTIDQSLYFGGFARLNNLTLSAINTAEPVIFDAAVPVNGVDLGTPASRVVVENSGLYSVNCSFQITSTSSSAKTIWLWFRINGVDRPNSAIKATIVGSGTIANPSRALFFSFNAGDYVEIYWASDSTSVTMEAAASTAFAPATPACIFTVEQIQQ